MSKKNEKEIIEIEPEEETNAEQTWEIVEEKKLNKVLSVAKKLAPFAVLGGIVAAAFAFGKSSGADAAYLEMLNDGNLDAPDAETSENETDAITDHAGDSCDK